MLNGVSLKAHSIYENMNQLFSTDPHVVPTKLDAMQLNNTIKRAKKKRDKNSTFQVHLTLMGWDLLNLGTRLIFNIAETGLKTFKTSSGIPVTIPKILVQTSQYQTFKTLNDAHIETFSTEYVFLPSLFSMRQCISFKTRKINKTLQQMNWTPLLTLIQKKKKNLIGGYSDAEL